MSLLEEWTLNSITYKLMKILYTQSFLPELLKWVFINIKRFQLISNNKNWIFIQAKDMIYSIYFF